MNAGEKKVVLSTFEKNPIVILKDQSANGRSRILIDVNRIKMMILLYEQPRAFEMYRNPQELLGSLIPDLFPALWSEIAARAAEKTLPNFHIAHFGVDPWDEISQMQAVSELHRQFEIQAWHTIGQNRTITFDRKGNHPPAMFRFQFLITIDVLSNERRITVFLDGAQVEKVDLIPK